MQMNYQEREEIAERRGRDLIELLSPQLPLEVRVEGPADAWALVGPCLLARQIGALEAIFALRPLDREADAIIVLRSLYEHAVTFAWLAVEPGAEGQRKFLKSDLISRLELDKDVREIGQPPPLTDEVRERYERERDGLPEKMPKLHELAEEADRHWGGTLPGWADSPDHSYRGLYAIAYRCQSMIAHPSLMGLNGVYVDLDDGAKRVQIEQREPEMHGPYGLGVILLAFSVYIAAEKLDWPIPADAVEAIFRA
jgi:hypothetical protein